ncbi:transglycosylase SLT domain-containing protein [Rheinheimera sp. UJ63]|uniref:transglycosylase SLT domain-containing protein n=1 Tax=Rheinheimera sp. UJ63 TaxID=2910157 RepID=UPI001F228F37|nr:transglycosylase SLT domain-containing protein [Rheinheimera sp. UJ63]MCF4010887.1 transglycosylase SLT domain-containing protein [Rheinheimera sp. UJ63]
MPASALGQPLVQPYQNWTDVVRSKPYAESQGVYDNVMNVRRWILTRSGHCTERNRHLLFDMRGNFLEFIEDASDSPQTQLILNQTRQGMAQQGRVHAWVEGNNQTLGYPFAIRCHQPYVDLSLAIARYLGKHPEGRLSGNWDGIKVGTPKNQASLHDTLRLVYARRAQQKRISLPEDLLADLAGMLIIESGGVREAHSKANARGILQLTPQVLKDCGVPQNKQLHRIAQVDCALWLFERNHRMLHPVFIARFGHLPEEKREQVYRLLLIQAYHGGPGRVRSLLIDEELSKPATYFAEHHQDFSAGDIAFGMVFHNLGRNRLGFASLYYTADIRIALQLLESQSSSQLFSWQRSQKLKPI